MSKHSSLGCLLKTAAVLSLFVPYRFEKTEEGFSAASIIGKVEYRKKMTPTETAEAPEGANGVTTLSVPGLAEDQLAAMKKVVSEIKSAIRRRRSAMTEDILKDRAAKAESEANL